LERNSSAQHHESNEVGVLIDREEGFNRAFGKVQEEV
jgi:hypothetical protein